MNFFPPTYKTIFRDRHYLISLALSFLLLGVSLVVNNYAAIYADDISSNAVSDIILSNTPVFDVHLFFVYGPLIFWTVIGLFCLSEPKNIPFMLKSIALFIIVRSVFISLTHLGPYPDRVIVDAMELGLLSIFSDDSRSSLWSSGGDLFFSAHTGLPFLMALVFWQHKSLRIFCLIGAFFFGAVVLLGHLHYSIDVLAAFFITYGIFVMATRLFREDWKLVQNKT